ncbi:MAG: MATE family efflux transporter [Sphaerochaetaceae bacterium]|jgi:putative MATE family efflux protein|nr:MATE family efflux transporter [Sphaerochaetaceae bacterium]
MVEIKRGLSSAEKGEFYSRLLHLAFPIMLQNLLNSSVSFIDTLMIGMVSESALAAVGLANQMFFQIVIFFYGVSSAAAIFIAQYWGAGNREGMHKVMGIALLLNLSGALLATFFSLFFPELLMKIFTNDPVVIAHGVEYLEVVAISYLFSSIVLIFFIALRSTGNAKTPLYVSAFAMVLNIILNYILILGKFGFPRMEVRGAALATTIARGAEAVLILFFVFKKKHPIAAPLKQYFSFDKALVKRYLTTGVPVILNEMFWSLGMTAYKIAFARMGTNVIAAVNVTEAIQGLFFVALMGISNASAIMIGNRLGEGRIDTSKQYASRLLITGLLMGAVLGVALALSSPLLPIPFNLSPGVFQMTSYTLIVMGILLPIKAYNMILIIGILRSGGDTRFSMFTELAGVWFIGVPLAFIGALVIKMPIYYLYLFLALEEVFKFVLGMIRIKSGKWINILIEDTSTTPVNLDLT